jgi:hypothetical protein
VELSCSVDYPFNYTDFWKIGQTSFQEELNGDIFENQDNVELKNYRKFHKVTKCLFFAKPTEKVIFAGFIQVPIYALPNLIPPIMRLLSHPVIARSLRPWQSH